MNDDPIVASVRSIRAELAAKFNYDVHAIFSDMRSRESQVGSRIVRQPKRAEQADARADWKWFDDKRV